MWYFSWVLGLGLACSFAILNAMWLEVMAPDEGLPWGWIGAAIGVLALGGAGAYAVVRRRKAPPAAVGTPGLFETLKVRFAARTKAPKADNDAAEPTLE